MKSLSPYTCYLSFFKFSIVPTLIAQESINSSLLNTVIDDDFWQLATDPDLGEMTGELKQPLDFCIDDDTYLVDKLPVIAPGIIFNDAGIILVLPSYPLTGYVSHH
jgi:hypothetical protein